MPDYTSRCGPRDSRRAVSPVIGVILMVAITVILAAVIGAFVLEIGDQQETAPSASFDSGERVITMGSERAGKYYGAEVLKGNTTQAYFTHAGGETLPQSQIDLSVNGHRDVWGIHPHYNALELGAGPIDDSTDAAPQPDFRRTMGTNEPVELASGESWNVIAADMRTRIYPGKDALREPPAGDDEAFPVKAGKQYLTVGMLKYEGETVIEIYEEESISPSGSYSAPYESGVGTQIGKGDQISIVWNAESGGKTQTLSKYTAQHTATDEKFTAP